MRLTDRALRRRHTLHRAERAAVQAEIEQAGFRLIDEGSFLARPEDPRTASVFDEGIRGQTSQFALVFQKPSAACPAG
jgi:predicted methyltransferase